MIYIGICDDEKYMLDHIRTMASRFFRGKNTEAAILEFSCGEELLKYDGQIDILFLDIQMKGMDGMETARRLRRRKFRGTLIFTTILREMVFEAFEVQAYDYLVKPIDASTLVSTIKVAMARSKELHGLRNEINKVTRDMESRKKIEQAKGLLMKKQNLDEQAAFDMIRAISKEKSMSMETVADIILCGIK